MFIAGDNITIQAEGRTDAQFRFDVTDTNTQRTDEEIYDLAAEIISGSAYIAISKNDANNDVNISLIADDTSALREKVEDWIADMIVDTNEGIDVSYDDPSDSINLSLNIDEILSAAPHRDDTIAFANVSLQGNLTRKTNLYQIVTAVTEDIQDVVAAMFTGGSHTRMSYTYDDIDGYINSVATASSTGGTFISHSDTPSAYRGPSVTTPGQSLGTFTVTANSGSVSSPAPSTYPSFPSKDALVTANFSVPSSLLQSGSTCKGIWFLANSTTHRRVLLITDSTPVSNLESLSNINCRITLASGGIDIREQTINEFTRHVDFPTIGTNSIGLGDGNTNIGLTFFELDDMEDGDFTYPLTVTMTWTTDPVTTSGASYAGRIVAVNSSSNGLAFIPSPSGVGTEFIQDTVAAFISAGNGIVVNYNDNNNVFQIAATGVSGSSGWNSWTDVDDPGTLTAMQISGINTSDEFVLWDDSGSNWERITVSTMRSVFAPTEEQVFDHVKNIIIGGTNVTASDSDTNNTVTLSASGTGGAPTEEQVFDLVKVIIISGNNISVSNNDNTNRFTINGLTTLQLQEIARDAVGTALVAGTNVTIAVNDNSNTITINSTASGTPSPPTEEQVFDLVKNILIGGTNVTITDNDNTNRITIVASGGGGSTIDEFTELTDTPSNYDASGTIIFGGLTARYQNTSNFYNYTIETGGIPPQMITNSNTVAGSSVSINTTGNTNQRISFDFGTGGNPSYISSTLISAIQADIYVGTVSVLNKPCSLSSGTLRINLTVSERMNIAGQRTQHPVMSIRFKTANRTVLPDLAGFLPAINSGATALEFIAPFFIPTVGGGGGGGGVPSEYLVSASVSSGTLTLTDDDGDTVEFTPASGSGFTEDQIKEFARDAIGIALIAGTNITKSVSDTGNTITLNATAGASVPTEEQVFDLVKNIIIGGTNVTVTNDDSTNRITIVASGTGGTPSEYLVSAVVSSRTLTITDDDGDTTIFTSTTGGTGLTQEQVEDIVSGMFPQHQQKGVVVGYDDPGGNLSITIDIDEVDSTYTSAVTTDLLALHRSGASATGKITVDDFLDSFDFFDIHALTTSVITLNDFVPFSDESVSGDPNRKTTLQNFFDKLSNLTGGTQDGRVLTLQNDLPVWRDL